MNITSNNNWLIITGGTGYIGSQLVTLALKLNYRVILLGRRTVSPSPKIIFLEWSLGEPIPKLDKVADFEPNTCTLIHLAHDWNDLKPIDSIVISKNAEATITLLDSANKIGISKFFFASSQSARKTALNNYGRIKWETESLLASHKNTLALRIGLVHGGKKTGMYGLLHRVSSLPMLPLVGGSTLVQPISINLLCLSILSLINTPHTGWVGLACKTPIMFNDFIKNLARLEHSKRILIIPIPLRLALWGCILSKYVPLLPEIDPERVLGLAGTQMIDNIYTPDEKIISEVNQIIEIEQKSLRGLILESKILFKYVFKGRAPLSFIKAYTKLILSIEDEHFPIALSPITHKYPWLLRFMEPTDLESKFSKRTQLTCALGNSRALNQPATSQKNLYMATQIFIDLLTIPIRKFFKYLNK